MIYHVPFFSPHTSECTLKLVGDSELGPIPNRQHVLEYPRYRALEYQARIQDSTKGGGPRVQTMMYWSPPHSKGAKSPDPLVPPLPKYGPDKYMHNMPMYQVPTFLFFLPFCILASAVGCDKK